MKKRIVIIAVIFILLLVGSGFGFWFWNYLNKPGKCLITTANNCKKLVKIQVEKPVKTTRLEMDVKKNIKIFSPIDGVCKTATLFPNDNTKGYGFVRIEGQVDNKKVVFGFVFNGNFNCPSENVKAGDFLKDVIKDSPMADYNNKDLVVLITTQKTEENYTYYVNDEDLMNKLLK